MEEDWDNLLILDGCRFDLFSETCSLDGSLKERYSPATCTRKWLAENFQSEYPDTVYVSANPQTQIHNVEDCFCNSVRVWDECWDDEIGTAMPEGVTERAIEISQQYPNKRLILHYVQPHYPFIGDTGSDIRHRGFHEKARRGVAVESAEEPTVWERLKAGAVDEDVVWNSYQENLTAVLPYVEKFAGEVAGKTVVSSDHGNCLGEYGIFGHPCGHYHPALVKVPWFEIEGESRKTITDGTLQEANSGDEESAKERLSDLGYL